MTATINVSIRATHAHPKDRQHDVDCAPILLPCPIPRSVTFQVVLDLGDSGATRVACTINGETWGTSDVDDDEIEIAPGQNAAHWVDDAEKQAAVAACRERWGYVKSLVLRHSMEDCPEAVRALRPQRDAVYTALADAHRHNVARNVALNAALEAGGCTYRYAVNVNEDAMGENYLADYINRVIEQVAVLS